MQIWDTIWHRWLKRPYSLAVTSDQGQGEMVVLLHGLGRSGRVWQHVTQALINVQCRVIVFDLLGFGKSPKPLWPRYDVDDHAGAVIASILAARPAGPVVLVGHSMGCLVAVRIARLRPDLVKQLVLYEMPLYEGLANNWRTQKRIEVYRTLYDKISQLGDTPSGEEIGLLDKWAQKLIGVDTISETWLPFVRSLQHTILEQTADDDLKLLRMPVDAIYGSLDILVIRGKVRQMFGEDTAHVTTHTIRERHRISEKASRFLSERIITALGASTDVGGHSKIQDLTHG